MYFEDGRNEKSIIVFDLDDTICEPTQKFDQNFTPGEIEKYFLSCVPKLEIAKKMQYLVTQGHEIEICTARREEDRTVTQFWLLQWNIPFSRLYLGKPRARVYVDDRAYRVKDITWEDIHQIDNLAKTEEKDT